MGEQEPKFPQYEDEFGLAQREEGVLSYWDDESIFSRVTDMRVDGGMVSNDWLCQHLADLCQISVQRPVNIETTALGAAMLALVGAGALPSLAAAGSLWELDRRFEAELGDVARERLLSGWHAAVSRTLGHAVD